MNHFPDNGGLCQGTEWGSQVGWKGPHNVLIVSLPVIFYEWKLKTKPPSWWYNCFLLTLLFSPFLTNWSGCHDLFRLWFWCHNESLKKKIDNIYLANNARILSVTRFPCQASPETCGIEGIWLSHNRDVLLDYKIALCSVRGIDEDSPGERRRQELG